MLYQQWQSFRFALQFLTCLPVGKTDVASPQQWASTLLWYPLVGLIIGLLLLLLPWLAHYSGITLSSLLISTLVLTLWVIITGALHLDGLSDSADAWVGGRGDKQLTLKIMKDPYAGPMGVVSIVLVLLLKLAALVSLVELARWTNLWIVPLFARAVLLAVFLQVPYVRQQGLGTHMAELLPKNTARMVLLFCAVLPLLVLPYVMWISCVLVSFVIFMGWRQIVMARLGGFTGDCAGALVEVLETMLLIVLAIAWGVYLS